MDKKINNPGETNQGEPQDSSFLFGKDKDIYLSELDQKSPAEISFLFGRHMAAFHAGGKIVKGWHADNIAINYEAEEVYKITSTGPIEEVELHPANMRQQFVEMHTSWGDNIIPLIGGYARAAYQIIDPKYPGYTDALLSILFEGPVKSSPAPLPISFDLDGILKSHHLKIDFDKKVVEVQSQQIDTEGKETDIILIAMVLLVAGINIDALITNICKDTDSYFTKALQSLRPNPNGNTERMLPTEAMKIFLEIMDYVNATKENPPEDEKLLSILIKNLGVLSPRRRSFYIDAIYDGVSALAGQLDKEKKFVASMQLAQVALILVQWQKNTTEALENRLCRVDANHHKLSWDDFKLNMDRDVDLLFTYGGFCLSATTTELLYFQTSAALVEDKRKSNYLWTALFQAINRQRKLVCLCYKALNNDIFNKNEFQDFIFFLQQVLEKYLQSLYMHLNTVQNMPEENPSVWIHHWTNDGKKGGKEFIMRREILLAEKLIKILKSKGIKFRFKNTVKTYLYDLVYLLATEQKGL